MRTIWIAILLTALAVPGYADVFVQQPNGSLVKKTGFKTTVLAADTVGKTVVVTGSETVTGTVTVPSGVAVRVDNGGYFTGTGSIDFNGQPFTATGYVFRNSGSVTGLKVARPELFTTNTTPGTTDTTAAITAAITAAPIIDLANTTYLVTTLSIPANKTIRTAGFATVLKQKSGRPEQTRIINVIGSNVTIGDLSFQGNIATDTNEQQHCIRVEAMTGIGALENITIGNVKGQDIRGDVIFLGSRSGYPLKNIKIASATGDNILRNVISIVGGTDIEIGSVTGSRVGLFTFDIEPESYTEPVKGVRVGYIKGRAVGIVGSSAAAYADGIEIGYLDLDHSYVADCSPSFSYYPSQDALALRNVKTIHIGTFRATGYNRSALYVLYNPGELGAENIVIDYASTSNNSLTDTTYNAHFFIQAAANTTIHGGNFSVTGNNKRVFDSFPRLIVENFTASLGTGSSFIRAGNGAVLRNGTVTGTGTLTFGGSRHQVSGVTFTGDYLASFGDLSSFDTVTATLSGGAFLGTDNHIVRNSTLNSVYYADGPYQRNYLNAIRFGAYYLWVDSGGKVRIKSSAPANDTDGTVVGTQS